MRGPQLRQAGPQSGHLVMSGDIFGCHDWGEGTPGIWWGSRSPRSDAPIQPLIGQPHSNEIIRAEISTGVSWGNVGQLHFFQLEHAVLVFSVPVGGICHSLRNCRERFSCQNSWSYLPPQPAAVFSLETVCTFLGWRIQTWLSWTVDQRTYSTHSNYLQHLPADQTRKSL